MIQVAASEASGCVITMGAIRKKTASGWIRQTVETSGERELTKLSKKRWPMCAGTFPDCPEFFMTLDQLNLLEDDDKPEVCKRCPYGWVGRA